SKLTTTPNRKTVRFQFLPPGNGSPQTVSSYQMRTTNVSITLPSTPMANSLTTPTRRSPNTRGPANRGTPADTNTVDLSDNEMIQNPTYRFYGSWIVLSSA